MGLKLLKDVKQTQRIIVTWLIYTAYAEVEEGKGIILQYFNQ